MILRRLGLIFAMAAGLAAQTFAPGRELMRFPASLEEISGLEASRTQAGVYWVHNDSGDQPRVYAVSSKGQLLGTYTLAGAKAEDWEDMSVGPVNRTKPKGASYLYMADIGDNAGRRQSITIYRVAEPKVARKGKAEERTLADVAAFELVYPDGPRDAESFFVDPLTGDFYIVSKRELDGNRLYRLAAAAQKPGTRHTLERLNTFNFTGATAAAISADGMQVMVLRYSSGNPFTPPSTAATYWRRADANTSIADLLRQPGEIVALVPEVQGEAVAFAPDGKGFYSTGERGEGAGAMDSPLTYYQRLK